MAEKIGLQISLEGAEKVLSELRQIDGFANKVDRKRIKLKADQSINNIKRNIDDINRALEQDFGKAEKKVLRNLRTSLQNTMREIQNEVKANDIKMEVDADTSRAEMKLGQIYNKWSGFASRIGSSMITAGNTLQRITSPFDSIVRGAMYGVGYGALNKVTEGLTSSTQRFDTLETYPSIMESLGFSSAKAKASIDKLNESVIGLPTGLDEIVDMAKRYALATGDIEKGTNVAIAANNAFLASAATDAQQYQGMMQLNDVLAGKKLQTREWMSLAASMPAAMQEIGKYLGYTKNSEFLQALYGNKIGNDKFLKALEAVGTETGKIAQMAEISKTTFAGLSSNIKNAFSRGGYKLLDALDNIFIRATGDGLVKNFKTITDGIDSIFSMGESWLNAHPDQVMEFFNYLRTFDWKGLVTGFASASKTVLGIIKNLFEMFSGGDTQFVGKFLVYGNLIGKVLTILGGGLKGLAPLVGGAGVLGTLAKAGRIGGLFGKILKPFAKIQDAKNAIKGAEAASKAGEAISKVPLSWQNVASQAVGVAAIPAAAGALFLAAKALSEFNSIDLQPGIIKKIGIAGVAVAAFVGEAAAVGGLLASNPLGWITTAGAAIGGTALAAAAGEMILIGKALNSFSKATIPDPTKVTEVMGAIKDIMSRLKGIEVPNMGKDADKNANSMSNILGSLVGMLNSSKQIAELKVTEEQLQAAEDAIGNLKPHMDRIKSKIAELYGNEIVSSTPRKTGKEHANARTSVKRQVYDGEALDAAYEDTGKVSGIVGYVTSFLDGMKGLNEKVAELKDLKIDKVTEDLNTYIGKMSDIADEIKKHSESFKGVEDAGKQFESIATAVKEMKKTINQVRKISEMSSGEGSVDITQILSNTITKISNGLKGIGKAQSKASQFASFADSIKSGLDNLKTINDVEINLDGFEATVATVVKKLKAATKKIKGAWNGLKKATDKIKDINKSISVTVSISGVDTAVQNMNSAASRLSAAYASLRSAMNLAGGGGGSPTTPKTPRLSGRKGAVPISTGGYIDGRGRVLYRASGGGVPVFKPIGTDTVPAMLTPGEYVNRRKSVKYFGAAFFQRLNHLDLEGALRSISTRAASGLGGGNVIHITNDNRQNNARVVQNISTHDTNHAFRRANRFVEAL